MTKQEAIDKFKPLGMRFPENLIQVFIGGSNQHGATSSEGNSDTDYYGVFIPPPDYVIGIDSYDSFCFPQNTEARSRGIRLPGELDVQFHSLQKFASLAAKGNPTIMGFLFATPEYVHPVWQSLIDNRHLFLAKNHLGAFLGYAKDQLERLLGQRGQKDCHRPELESRHGYDTKYAMHIIRLLVEGEELMHHGRISYPNREVNILKRVRNGAYSLDDIRSMACAWEDLSKLSRQHSSLPDQVDRYKISRLLVDMHQQFWGYL